MNNTITNTDIHTIFLVQASQDVFSQLEETKRKRITELELLYQFVLKDLDTTPILRTLAILDEKYAEQWNQYLTLVLAHQEAVKTFEDLSKQPQQTTLTVSINQGEKQ